MSEKSGQTIGPRTSVVCLLGHPVHHSRSPAIHNAAFAAQGLDFVYLAFDVLPQDLGPAVVGLRALGLTGANVTIPHKETVIPFLDRIDPIARRLGAVNTVVNEGGTLHGSNTDVPGFLAALWTGWGRGPAGARCLVVGAGGAARAVVAGLVSESAGEIIIFNRTAERADRLAADAASWSDVPVRVADRGDLAFEVSAADLIVDATSAGLDPDLKVAVVPVDTLHSGQCVMDLVYGRRGLTPILEAARVRGAIAIDGTEMLVQQAARSYATWTGNPAPVETMRGRVLGT